MSHPHFAPSDKCGRIPLVENHTSLHFCQHCRERTRVLATRESFQRKQPLSPNRCNNNSASRGEGSLLTWLLNKSERARLIAGYHFHLTQSILRSRVPITSWWPVPLPPPSASGDLYCAGRQSALLTAASAPQ